MSHYMSNTQQDREEMLEAIGVASVDDLFAVVPEAMRFPSVELPPPLSEAELLRELRRLSAANANAQSHSIVSGRRRVQPFRSVGGRRAAAPRRVLYRLYALPAGDRPGHAAGDLRVPDADLRADRHGRRQCLALRRRDGAGRGRRHGAELDAQPPHDRGLADRPSTVRGGAAHVPARSRRSHHRRRPARGDD